MAYAGWGKSAMTPSELKSLRGERTKTAFAAQIGVTLQTLMNWETGRSKPTRPRLSQLQKLRDNEK
jgi:DNA-binding transcriptional regulator YiaG